MIQNVLVLGGGSAGFLAALTLKTRIPALAITILRSKEIGIIGVGEGTTVAVPKHLHSYLNFDPGEFHRQADPTWKLGIRFLWGSRPFFDYTFNYQMDWKWERLSKNNGYYCDEACAYADQPSALMSHNKAFVRQANGDPLIGRDFGYHIENEKFVTYLEGKATERGINIVDDTVADVRQDDQGIAALHLTSGAMLAADLYVDCSGFRSLLLGQTLGERFISFKPTLLCDRAIPGGWQRTDEPIKPYTTAETMNAGWCWQIEHLTRIIRGYVYSSDFISDEEAEREFRQKNPKVESTRIIKFPSGRYDRSWVKNVVAIGNASGFVEPLEATSLAVICDESRLLAESLVDCERQPGPTLKESYNHISARAWDTIRYFLGMHYKFNTRLDTPFWRACREKADLGPAESIVDYYRDNGPSTYGRTALLRINDIFGMEGYLCMLVGQRVPYRKTWQAPVSERQIWNGIRAEHRAKALTGMTIPEAYQAILSPEWRWVPDFFRQ